MSPFQHCFCFPRHCYSKLSDQWGKNEAPAFCPFSSPYTYGRGSAPGCTISTKHIQQLSRLEFPDTACLLRPWKSGGKVKLVYFDGQLPCGVCVVVCVCPNLRQWVEVRTKNRGPLYHLEFLKALISHEKGKWKSGEREWEDWVQVNEQEHSLAQSSTAEGTTRTVQGRLLAARRGRA